MVIRTRWPELRTSRPRQRSHVGLGEIDAFFESIACAIDERDPHVLELPVKPIYDGVRNDPRFAALLRTMHLA